MFKVQPANYQLASSDFTYYIETSIPHTIATGAYDLPTSILTIKVKYIQSIEDDSHVLKITMDPYKMSVQQKIFNFKASGINFDLTIDDMAHLYFYKYYTISLSGLIVVAAIIFTIFD